MNQQAKTKQETVAFDPWILWIAFRRHWGWVLPVGLVLAALGALGVQATFEPTYVATHFLRANQDWVLDSSLHRESRDLARSEKNLITHASVLNPVLELGELRAAPSLSNPLTLERELRKRISIGNGGSSELLTVSYEDSDAEYAARICNAIVEQYLRIRSERDDQRMGEIQEWLNEPIRIWKLNVENKRQELSELTKEAQGYDPFKPNSAVESDSSRLAVLRVQLAELGAEEIVAQSRLKALDASQPSEQEEEIEIDPLLIRPYVDSDPAVREARTEVTQIQAMIREYELSNTNLNVNPQVERLQIRLRAAKEKESRAQAVAEEAGRKSYLNSMAKSSEASSRSERQRIEMELFSIQSRKAAYEKDYDEEKGRIESLSGETAKIFFAKEEYAQSAEILSQLQNRSNMIEAEQGRGASIRTLAEATAPSFPKEEIPWKKIMLASGALFMLPFAFAALLEFRYKRLTTAEAMEAASLAPIMGEIAKIPGGAEVGRRHQLFEESIDALRANLLFQIEQVRTIVVTSAMPSEGKSSVASQLAISLAKSTGETVLLIDADLRSPDQHELLGLDVEPGLVKLLSDRSSLDESIDKSLGDLVHVIPAGRLDLNPHHILTKKTMHDLFEELKEQYQYIMVDTAPILPAAESLAVTAAADATLLCAMRDVSRTDHVLRTHRRLEASGSNVIGTVFSGVPFREYAYRYGHYRYRVDAQSA